MDICSGQRTLEPELVGDAFDAVGGVDVLDHGDLVAACRPLAGDDGGIGEEVFPYLLKVSAGSASVIFDTMVQGDSLP